MKRYEAYNIHTQQTVAESDTIQGLAELLYITRQTASKHIATNIVRDLIPKTLPGGVVLRDTWTTERLPAQNTPRPDDKYLYHVYKANTGQYIASMTISDIYNKLRLNSIGALLLSIDRHPLYKYNVAITRDIQPEPYFLPESRRAHEMFDNNKMLCFSTFYPELIGWWGKPRWEMNPYKPYHYMAFLDTPNPLPKNHDKYDYLPNPDELLLDNDESI